ncbi:MAG: segregation/condensation protein A [Anaerolineales bacterium]|nr:segregation/condensation protein A [Chloroflexota bacterium]MBL7164136.1 segregation/condensation protein A [Anaerolineales bacterium]
MKFDFASQQIGDYKVVTPVYEGPLDLLLQLIEQAELDITKLAIAQVTDQYLAHIRNMPDQEPEQVSAFLVIAAKLLQIKSEALLPRPPVREEGEEDPGEALARQLLAYKRYKEIADTLEQRESDGLRSFLRLAPPPKVQEKVDFGEFGLVDLFALAEEVFSQVDNRPVLGTVVSVPRVTIREKIDHIVQTMQKRSHTSFSQLLGEQRARLDVVVTFIAMLELVKRHFVRATQDSLFSEIHLEPANGWDDEIDFELEFGE